MNRRQFLKSASGLFVTASAPLIFDLGANSWRKPKLLEPIFSTLPGVDIIEYSDIEAAINRLKESSGRGIIATHTLRSCALEYCITGELSPLEAQALIQSYDLEHIAD
jgi:hypothetical protein